LTASGRIFPIVVQFSDIENSKVRLYLVIVPVEVPEAVILFVVFSLTEHRLRFYRTLAARCSTGPLAKLAVFVPALCGGSGCD
jgi:hypothetical protein